MASIEERRKRVEEYQYNSLHLSHMLNAIANEIKEGDVILAKWSKSDIVGMGVVTSKYHYEGKSVYGTHCCDVTWTHKGLWHCDSILKDCGKYEFPAKALTNVSNQRKYPYITKIIEMLESETALNKMDTADKKKQMGHPSQTVLTITELLKNSGQIILQGAPGCGKTYITTELAVYLCDGEIPADRAELKTRYKELHNEGRIGFTTFHQSLDYEEFVEGMKPETNDKTGEMHFEVKPGIFRRMCSNAQEGDAPLEEYLRDGILVDKGNLEEKIKSLA